MPNITPRHHDEPQAITPIGTLASTSNQITLSPIATIQLDNIRMMDGLYCLNDLHKLAGGEKKHQPTNFMRRNDTRQLIAEIDRSSHSCTLNNSNRSSDMRSEAYLIIQGGEMQGTYVCRELVYAYANWISPAFYLVVIRTFDSVLIKAQPLTLSDKFNQKTADLKAVIDYLHECGSGLATHGKKTKPRLLAELKELLDHIQPQLPFTGSNQ